MTALIHELAVHRYLAIGRNWPTADDQKTKICSLSVSAFEYFLICRYGGEFQLIQVEKWMFAGLMDYAFFRPLPLIDMPMATPEV